MLTQSPHLLSSRSRVRVTVMVEVEVSENACYSMHLRIVEVQLVLAIDVHGFLKSNYSQHLT